MKYEFLNNLSGAIVLITLTLIFSMLFESRYSTKKYLASLIPFLTVLFAVNLYAIFKFGFSEYGKYTVITATIPSLIYFFITSNNRDGRFLFTFCLADTSAILFSLITGIIDYYLNANGIFNFCIRVIISPIIIFVVYKYIRAFYLNIMHTVKKGWWLFTLITAIAYALLIFVSSVPVTLRERPEDIPVAILIAILLPLMYFNIFHVLSTQKQLNDMGTIQHVFAMQSAMMKSKADEIQSAEEKLRMERHDLRHQIKVIEEFTLNGERQELLDYIGYVQNTFDELKVERYCSNPVLDAILSSYIRQAKDAKIEVQLNINLPNELPVPAVELATVFANTLENAINANLKLPEKDRKIIFNCLSYPMLMFEIKNPCKNKVKFDSRGLPIANSDGHGIGSQSVFAFCKAHDATYTYEKKDGWFRIMVSL